VTSDIDLVYTVVVGREELEKDILEDDSYDALRPSHPYKPV
jgi:hypothetical protein